MILKELAVHLFISHLVILEQQIHIGLVLILLKFWFLVLLVMLLLLHRRGPVTTLRRTVPLYLRLWRASVRVSMLLLVTTALDTAHRRRRRRAPHPRLAHRRALLFHHRRLDDDDDPAFTNRDATAHIFSSVVRPSRARVVRPSCVVERDIPLARAREISRRGRAIRFDPP